MKATLSTKKIFSAGALLLVFGGIPAFPSGGYAQENLISKSTESTAAVWDLANLSKPALSEATMEAITQYVGVKVFNIMPNYRWLDRGNIKEVLEEQKFQASGCTDQTCVVEMGQLLGARKMVSGSIGKTGNTYNLTLSVIDIRTGLIDKTASEICPDCDEGQLYQLAENTVIALSGKSPGKLRSSASPVHKHRLNIDLNYPGVGVRYFFFDRTAVELRGQYIYQNIDDAGPSLPSKKWASVLGVRVYHYTASSSRTLRPYLCLEADYIPSFRSSFSRGDGYAGGAFGGVEYFIGRGFTVQTDVGAAYIQLRDKATSIKSGGVEYIMNFGINVYFNR